MASHNNYDIFSVPRRGQSRRSPSPSPPRFWSTNVAQFPELPALFFCCCCCFNSCWSRFPPLRLLQRRHSVNTRSIIVFRPSRLQRFGARFGSSLDHLSIRGCLPECRWPARHLAGVFEAQLPMKIWLNLERDRNSSNSLFLMLFCFSQFFSPRSFAFSMFLKSCFINPDFSFSYLTSATIR